MPNDLSPHVNSYSYSAAAAQFVHICPVICPASMIFTARSVASACTARTRIHDTGHVDKEALSSEALYIAGRLKPWPFLSELLPSPKNDFVYMY